MTTVNHCEADSLYHSFILSESMSDLCGILISWGSRMDWKTEQKSFPLKQLNARIKFMLYFIMNCCEGTELGSTDFAFYVHNI